MSDEQQKAIDEKVTAAEKSAQEQNEKRTGIGTRLFVGKTRGRNPVVITYESFDRSKPETLPTDMEKFMEVTGVSDESAILGFVIDGYNDAMYTNASDPLSELLEDHWPDDVKLQFRTIVRNYARALEMSLDDAAADVKDKFDKKYPKK